MELALISDVHSNLPALEAVLEDAGHREIFCCGDIVGYNPFPREVVELLQKRGVKAIRGNHDHAVATGDTGWLNPYAAAAAEWTMAVLRESDAEFLRSLPEGYADRRFKAFHGSPRDPLYEYVYGDTPDAVLESFLGEGGILFLGHTHIPFVRRLKEGIVLNPGSVGQPRDGDPRAAYAVVDIERGEVELRRVPYDIDLVAERIIESGLPERLAKRLYLGV
ncbi:MAG: metallophosphoesterase [Methanobacteriota archaeon]|nr:MAG: metallophosphoesterase [Euryarchaeota archaeon]